MTQSKADIIGHYGPFPGADNVAGVAFDGTRVWFASAQGLRAFDPETGEIEAELPTLADAGTTFDGTFLYQIAELMIRKIDPSSGEIVREIPTPGDDGASGLAWAEGSLWVGKHRGKKIHRVDPDTGEILGTIESDRFVTGVCWVGAELWHGTWQDERSDLRRVDPCSGAVLECLEMPRGAVVSGLDSDGEGRFFCGGGPEGGVRAVRLPRAQPGDRGAAATS